KIYIGNYFRLLSWSREQGGRNVSFCDFAGTVPRLNGTVKEPWGQSGEDLLQEEKFSITGKGVFDPNGFCLATKELKKGRGGSVLGLQHSSWKLSRKPGKGGVCCGRVRVLGTQGRDMPNTKKYELFIPYPANKNDLLPISKDALRRFNQLAFERAADNRNNRAGNAKSGNALPTRERKPYLPFRQEDEEQHDWQCDKESRAIIPKLREGQLVYFDVAKGSCGKPVVSALSFSAIWRDGAKGPAGEGIATVGDFFHQVDSELLPLPGKGKTKRTRKTLTPAERLFGFVEPDFQPSSEKENGALAGRVRFLDAIGEQRKGDAYLAPPQAAFPDDPDYEGYTPLRILAAPKPPSPALYFSNRKDSSKHISKQALKLGAHEPQGRKMYLHRHIPDDNSQPWVTRHLNDNKEQKSAVKPVKRGSAFWFAVDFDNLTSAELDLLCFALRPSPAYRHKIGMGKSLGLGTIRVDPVGIFLVDRLRRYGRDDMLAAPRYHALGIDAEELVVSMGDDPRFEREDAQCAPGAERPETCDTVARRAENHRRALEECMPDTAFALHELGETHFAEGGRGDKKIPVEVPLDSTQSDPEEQTFAWFVANDHRDQREKQQLAPLKKENGLPKLKRISQPQRNRNRPQGQNARRGGANRRRRG
ncbi:MAG: TIGR03986 family CRISPR-associated RAMP protein, partial [Alphaproteobacteria bacterium]